MAYDLAKLVVRLEAQSAQLLTELEKANQKINGFERKTGQALDRINKKFTSFGFGIKTALGAFLGGVSLNAVINAGAEATEQFAQLENSVERAGRAAGGRTAAEFRDIAGAIANVTTETGGAVQNVQQLLLRFQNIRTDRFDEATRRVLDFATAMRVDLDTAAKTVGRALSDPEKGMTALAKAGVVFSEQQQKVIKDLVETGRRAEAQGILLDALQAKYGGAAEAARNTFGGALKAVKNALGDLMEPDDGLPGATSSLNELATILQDPAVKAGAQSLFAIIVGGAAGAAKLIGELAGGIGALFSVGGDRVQKLQDQIDFLNEQRNSFLPFIANFGGKGDIFPEGGLDVLGPSKIDEKIRELEDEMDKILGLGRAGMEVAKQVRETFQATSDAFELPDIEVIDGATEAADKLRQKLEAQGAALTEKVQYPFEKYQATIKQADQLLAAGVITWETWHRAVEAARIELEGVAAGMLKVSERYQTLEDQIRSGKGDAGDALSKAFEKSNDEMVKDFEKSLKEQDKAMTVWAEQAARNTQDILARGLRSALHDGIKDGAEGVLKAFGDMLEEMALQAIAADIAGKIFGEGEGDRGLLGKLEDWRDRVFGGGGSKSGSSTQAGGGGGGLLDSIFGGGQGGGIFGGLGNLFGGWMDDGGYGRAGVPVAIGTGAQPEIFVPDVPGHFYPRGEGMGGNTVNQVIKFEGPQSQRTVSQLAVEAQRRQRTAAARVG